MKNERSALSPNAQTYEGNKMRLVRRGRRDWLFSGPEYSIHMPVWLANVEERAFIREVMKAAPGRMHVYNPWPDKYVDRASFPSLRLSWSRLLSARAQDDEIENEWQAYGQYLDEAVGADCAIGADGLPIENAKMELERLERMLEDCSREAHRAQRYERDMEWLCRAEAELICARQEAADAASPDPDRARAWVKDCERYVQILTESWRAQNERLWEEGGDEKNADWENKLGVP